MTASTAVVICEPLRTPVGRMGGALAPLSATELATVALEELVRRTGLGEGDVDDVILGNGYANGEAPAIGRVAALDAGLGTRVPGLQIDRRCGSGLQAVLYAAAQVATGDNQPGRPRGDLPGGIQHRLQAGPTPAIDLQTGHAGTETGVERRHPTDRR